MNGRPGVFDVQRNTQILTFRIAGGQQAVIQAPVSLGWNSAELAKFASGVHRCWSSRSKAEAEPRACRMAAASRPSR